VADLEGSGLLPVDVGFGKTTDIDLIGCHISGDKVDFSVVGSGVEAIRVLEEKPEGAGRFIEGEGMAPVLKGSRVDRVFYGGLGWLGGDGFRNWRGHGTEEKFSRGRGEGEECKEGERERARSAEEAEETD
jgi:hypothetical protein